MRITQNRAWIARIGDQDAERRCASCEQRTDQRRRQEEHRVDQCVAGVGVARELRLVLDVVLAVFSERLARSGREEHRDKGEHRERREGELWRSSLPAARARAASVEDRHEDHRDVEEERVRREAERAVDLDPPQPQREDRDGDERCALRPRSQQRPYDPQYAGERGAFEPVGRVAGGVAAGLVRDAELRRGRARPGELPVVAVALAGRVPDPADVAVWAMIRRSTFARGAAPSSAGRTCCRARLHRARGRASRR